MRDLVEERVRQAYQEHFSRLKIDAEALGITKETADEWSIISRSWIEIDPETLQLVFHVTGGLVRNRRVIPGENP